MPDRAIPALDSRQSAAPETSALPDQSHPPSAARTAAPPRPAPPPSEWAAPPAARRSAAQSDGRTAPRQTHRSNRPVPAREVALVASTPAPHYRDQIANQAVLRTRS